MGLFLGKDDTDHMDRRTNKSALEGLCDIAGSCDPVTRVNVGADLGSGFVSRLFPIIASILCNSLCVNNCLGLWGCL